MPLLDSYFPFADDPVYRDRWRQMARLWSPSGVVRGWGDAFWLLAWSQDEQTCAVGTGAAWINGFYGERQGGHWMSCPGNDGLIKALMDPSAQNIQVRYEASHTWIIEDPNGYWEIPLIELFPDGRWVDRRHLIPEVPAPPTGTLPPSTPRGIIQAQDGGLVDAGGTEANANVAYVSTAPGFEVHRTLRFSANARFHSQPGGGTSLVDWFYVDFWARDDAGMRRVQRMFQGGGGDATNHLEYFSEFTVPDVQANLVAVISGAVGSNTSGIPIVLRFENTRIEVFDAGGPP